MLTSIGRMHRWRNLRAGVLAVAIGGIAAGCSHGENRHGHRALARGDVTPQDCAAMAREHLTEASEWVDLRLDLDGGQRALLDEVAAAAAGAQETYDALCDRPASGDVAAMLDYSEGALEGALAGLRRVRPAIERFVASLDDEQRAEVEAWLARRRHRGWRHG